MALDLDPYIVVTADAHAGADLLDYKPYLEKRWHDEFDAWAPNFHDPWLDFDDPESDRRSGVASAVLKSNWDNSVRITDMDLEGIAGELVFPNTAPPFFPVAVIMAGAPTTRDEYNHRWAGLRAHNRWMVDFCALAPGRRAGMAQLFVNDLEDAIAEVRWSKEAGLNGGILLPQIAPGSDLAPYFSEEYEPLWAVCEDLEVPINTHIVGTPPAGNFGGSRDAAAAHAVQLLEQPYFGQRVLWHLMFAGVFERHPDIKLICTEQVPPIAWIPERLQWLENAYLYGKATGAGRGYVGDAAVTMLHSPREYWARNCYVGASMMLPSEVALRHEVGVDRIMWGSDYPHGEGTFPYTRQALRATFADVPVSEVRQMVGGNAIEVYGFNRALLADVASRIGPTVEEVATPVTEMPPVPAWMMQWD